MQTAKAQRSYLGTLFETNPPTEPRNNLTRADDPQLSVYPASHSAANSEMATPNSSETERDLCVQIGTCRSVSRLRELKLDTRSSVALDLRWLKVAQAPSQTLSGGPGVTASTSRSWSGL